MGLHPSHARRLAQRHIVTGLVGCLDSLAVVDQWRGKGIARALVAGAEQAAGSHLAGMMALSGFGSVRTSVNEVRASRQADRSSWAALGGGGYCSVDRRVAVPGGRRCCGGGRNGGRLRGRSPGVQSHSSATLLRMRVPVATGAQPL
ncbi:hypothetical protein [Streptomyces sp. NPDC048425]|uniref:hypothetical protein n=1 Tax=Streptomyces sp. NPDC048425 TaxID=3365548 RepID=UPI00371715CC